VVAVFGTLYLAVMGHGSAGTSRSFGVVTAMLAAVAVLAGVAAWRATHAMSRRGERQAWRESRSAASAICYLGGN
jgi:hypothetical protein